MKSYIKIFVLVFFVLPVFADMEAAASKTLSAKERESLARSASLPIPFIQNESQLTDPSIRYYAPLFAGMVFVRDDEIIYSLRSGKTGAAGGIVIKERLLNAAKTRAQGMGRLAAAVSCFKGKDKGAWKRSVPVFAEVGFGEPYNHVRASLKARQNNVEKLFVIDSGGRPDDILLQIDGARGLSVSRSGELEIQTSGGVVRMTKPVAFQNIDGRNIFRDAAYAVARSAGPNNLVYGFSVKNYDRRYPLTIDPLLASTFIGGRRLDTALGITIDAQGNVFVVGGTNSPDFPSGQEAYDTSTHGLVDIFIVKFDSSLTRLLSATIVGGRGMDIIDTITTDAQGNVLCSGWSNSSDFPVTAGSYDTAPDKNIDATVIKLDNNLSSLLASTFIGGSDYDDAVGLTVDSKGDICIAGYTMSPDFPTTQGVFGRTFNGAEGDRDGFVAKLDSGLTRLLAATHIGGSAKDFAYAIAVDPQDSLFISGGTESPEFPVTSGAFDTSHNGGTDIFVAKLESDLSRIAAATFIGGSRKDADNDLVLDPSGNVLVLGYTQSSDYPVTAGAYETKYSDNRDTKDVVVSKLDSNLSTLIGSTFLGGGDDESINVNNIAVDQAGSVFVTGATKSRDYPVTGNAGLSGSTDVFVTKLNGNLTELMASTLLGGRGKENCYAIALDTEDNVYITGDTASIRYPTTESAYDASFNGLPLLPDSFVTKLDNNLD